MPPSPAHTAYETTPSACAPCPAHSKMGGINIRAVSCLPPSSRLCSDTCIHGGFPQARIPTFKQSVQTETMADSTNIVAGPHRPKGETDPNTRVVPGQLLPTKPNLDQILEKFLSVYDSASILKNNTLPWYALHRDYYKLDSSRAPAGPIPGNDFHATDPRITADASAWAAKLRFAPCHRSILAGTEALCPLTVSFKHINDCPEWDDSSRELAEAAALIRHLWPKEEIGEPVGRLVGEVLTDTKTPEYYLLHWLASQPINRGVAVYTFTRGLEEKFLAARKQGVCVTSPPSLKRQVKGSAILTSSCCAGVPSRWSTPARD